MASHKKQHFVPRSYLKAWCDPRTPTGQRPCVWFFNKDGSNPQCKAPKRIFRETDLYTIHRRDGQRDLVLEHGLASLESEFVGIRDTKLSQRREPTLAEGVLLCAFIAAAHARTPAQRDHLGGEFTKLREMMEDMIEWAKTATPEQKHGASAVARGAGPSLGYEDVKQLAEKTMETMLVPQIEEMTPLLTALDFAVLEAATEASFITSDDPCVWFDPEGYKRPPLYQGPGLICGSVEITLPVSPRQMILLNQKGRSGYFAAPTRVVDDLNRRTRAHCSEYFVSNSSSTKPIWFDPGAEPNDSWRKRHTAELDDQE